MNKVVFEVVKQFCSFMNVCVRILLLIAATLCIFVIGLVIISKV